MIQVNIQADFDEARKALRRLSDVEIGIAMKTVLQTIATAGKNWVKRRRAGLTQRSGWLKRHVYGYRRSDTHVVISAPRFIAEPLERGATIKPRRRGFLYIEIGRAHV